MVEGEIELKETELLVLQNLLGGDNFGASFDDFRNKNIDAAQFRADERGHLYRTAMVEQAQEGGRLSELHFLIEVPPKHTDREIKVVAHREGYFRSRQKGPHVLLDQFIGNLAIVMEYRDKLVPLDERLEKYIEAKSLSIGETRRGELMEVNRAFKDLIAENFNAFDFEEGDMEVYKSIIANVGIELYKLNLRDDEYPDISDFDGGNIDHHGKISEFFEVYSVRVEGYVRPDFDLLAGHLYYIMNRRDDYDSLTGMLEFVEDTYDI